MTVPMRRVVIALILSTIVLLIYAYKTPVETNEVRCGNRTSNVYLLSECMNGR